MLAEPRFALTLTPLFELQLHIGYERTWHVENAPAGRRSAFPVDGGEFVGARLRGTVEPTGMDWVRWRGDGAMEIDMRTMLRTDDGALIAMSYTGMAVVGTDADSIAAAQNFDRSEEASRSVPFARTTPRFETGAPAYAWINRIVAVGKGRRNANGPHYSIFQVD